MTDSQLFQAFRLELTRQMQAAHAELTQQVKQFETAYTADIEAFQEQRNWWRRYAPPRLN